VFEAAGDLCWGETAGSRTAQAEVETLIRGHLGLPTEDSDIPPLRAASALVEDDLCLMERRAGAWTLTAASLCAPSFFSAPEVVGKPLSALHAPVPGFSIKLLSRVERIFDALAVETLLERRNWSVVASGELFLPDGGPVRDGERRIAPEAAGRELFIRMERQTLRKLPATGAVLFTIRIWRHPLDALRADPHRLKAFEAAWNGVMSHAGEDFRSYKRLADLDPLVRSFIASSST
jgi:hypothetical protein